MNREQKLRKLHRNRDIYLFSAIVQFVVGIVFAWIGGSRGDALYVGVAVLAVGSGGFVLWRIKHVANAVEQFRRPASGSSARV